MAATAGVWKKKRDDLKDKRNALFETYAKTPKISISPAKSRLSTTKSPTAPSTSSKNAEPSSAPPPPSPNS